MQVARFDLLAPHYRWMEWVLAGSKLQRCRLQFLDEIAAPSRALLVGEGHGRFLASSLKLWPGTRFTVVEASQAMLVEAKRSLNFHSVDSSRVEWIHSPVEQWATQSRVAGSFDLIATHFFLDCFDDGSLTEVVSSLALCAAPNSSWLLSDFQIPSSGLQRIRARAIHWWMYRFFRWMTGLPASRWVAPDPYLLEAGFQLEKRQETEWGLLRSDWWIR